MDHQLPHLDTLLELETRHEDLLRRLGELDKRVETVLKQCQPGRGPEGLNSLFGGGVNGGKTHNL